MSIANKKIVQAHNQKIWTSTPNFIAINLLIAGCLMLIFCPTCLLSLEGLKSIVDDFVFAFLFSCVLSFGGSKVDDFFEHRISWIKQPLKRLILTIITYMIYCFISTLILAFFISWFYGQFTLDDIQWRYLFEFTKQPMLIALIVMAVFTTRSWLLEWRKSAIEAEQLRSEKLASQYQGLRDQLNPHFLFNSLNVLTNLVYEDADRSAAFIQKLSKIYRYVLDVQNEELVELQKEVSFANNYLELQKIRFEDSLEFKIELNKTTDVYLPPLSLQLLLENAIKHNEASQDNPLFINIIQKDGVLWVSNTFQPKSRKEEPSKGIGLENIRLRYRHLSQKEINVTVTENEYLVQLPLLKLS